VAGKVREKEERECEEETSFECHPLSKFLLSNSFWKVKASKVTLTFNPRTRSHLHVQRKEEKEKTIHFGFAKDQLLFPKWTDSREEQSC